MSANVIKTRPLIISNSYSHVVALLADCSVDKNQQKIKTCFLSSILADFSVRLAQLLGAQTIVPLALSRSDIAEIRDRVDKMLTPCRRVLTEKCTFYYPFGDTSVRNVLKDCQLDGDNIKVLFLGSGDLRNALKTAGNRKNTANLDIHLNDINPSVVARNILILKIISADGFDIQNEEDISFLWDLWYNAEWPESTRKRFESVLKELLGNYLPDNVVIQKSSYLLRNVWSAWISINSKSKSESDLFMKKIQKERKTIMFNGWYRLHQIDVDPNESPESLFPKIVNGYASFLALPFKGFPSSKRQKIEEEFRSYYSTGSCRLRYGMGNVCVNPTMLDPKTYRWQVHYQLSPFHGYLPLIREELDTSDDKGILIRTCQKILKNLVADYNKYINGVKFFFHFEDAVQFCLSESTLVFDVIDCSNLADHIGLVHLINGCEKILADTPGAILFTETMTWKSLAPSGLEYVEETLCCPLSLIPTIYGLQLLSHVELGSSKPTNNLLGNKIPPIMLCWKKAPTFQNVTLSPSPDLNRCLDKLAQRCFLPQNLQNAKISMKSTAPRAGARCLLGELLSLTPFTFSYVLNSMIARVGGGDPLFFRTDDLELPPVYNLSRRMLEAWKNKKFAYKYSSILQMNLLDQIPGVKRGFQHTAAMRLILAPQDKFLNSYLEAICRQQLSVYENDFSDPAIHVIDNFQLEVDQNVEGEIETAILSFLLMPDHGLKDMHGAYVFDVANPLLPIFLFKFVSFMRVEKYHLPYPFPTKISQPPVTKSSFMRVDSCTESIDKYTLKIAIECRKDISGLTVSPNQTLPCESVHGLTLSLRQPNDIEPLALNFPFPILVNEIRATLHRKTRSIDLVLKKALYEPWPCEFLATTQSRWNVDNLKPWEDGSEVDSQLIIHLGLQFTMKEILSLLSKVSPLNQVRGAIHSLMKCNEEFVCVRRKDSPQTPEWYIRVHFPVRVSPLGSPILLLSAVDLRLIEKFDLQGKVDVQQNSDDFMRIFDAPRYKKNPDGNMLILWTYNSEEEQLLRYVLRLNSTKIIPSIWQKKNLPQGENSSWLATFVSPLYDECPMDGELWNSFQMEKEIKKVPTSCAACNKISENLKRCSRCRSIFYCSVECQRGHWARHKNVCKNF